MKVIHLVVGPLASNAYVVKDDGSPAGLVIDPGADGARIVSRCRQEGVAPRFIVNTHGHVDHVGANGALKEAFPEAELCIGAADADMLTDADLSLAAFIGGMAAGPAADRLLSEGDELTAGSVVVRVLETPGHTPGGVCLLAPGEDPPQMFCGDLVFAGGVGRTDFPGGSWTQLMDSIRDKVLVLPDETQLWPGHGEPTTVGRERSGNPFLHQVS